MNPEHSFPENAMRLHHAGEIEEAEIISRQAIRRPAVKTDEPNRNNQAVYLIANMATLQPEWRRAIPDMFAQVWYLAYCSTDCARDLEVSFRHEEH
jgi:hypothetical protein